MTLLFLLSLAAMGFAMKLVVLVLPPPSRWSRWRFIGSPLLLPPPAWRAASPLAARALLRHTVINLLLLAALRWGYWNLVGTFQLQGMMLSYLAVPLLLATGEAAWGVLSLVWLATGQRLPQLHRSPFLAEGIADFWGRRWNLWFSDWFRYVFVSRWRDRPGLAVWTVFAVSGAMHEWVINVPFNLLTGRAPFGTMMLYFLLQAAGLMMERRFLRKCPRSRVALGWATVFGTVPLLINEGLLRALLLWPE